MYRTAGVDRLQLNLLELSTCRPVDYLSPTSRRRSYTYSRDECRSLYVFK